MGHDPNREPPFFFAKPADAVVPNGGILPFPSATEDLHHEIELVVALGEGEADLTASAALSHVFGYAVGLDMTRRDLAPKYTPSLLEIEVNLRVVVEEPLGNLLDVECIVVEVLDLRRGHPGDARPEPDLRYPLRRSPWVLPANKRVTDGARTRNLP